MVGTADRKSSTHCAAAASQTTTTTQCGQWSVVRNIKEPQYTGEHSIQCVESIMLVDWCPYSVLKILY